MPLERSTEDIPASLASACKDTVCAICKNSITETMLKAVTVCKHEFHKICITSHVRTNAACPVCGVKITKDVPASTSKVNSPVSTRSKVKTYESSQRFDDLSLATNDPSVVNPDPSLSNGNTLGELKQFISSTIAEQQAEMLSTLTSQLAQLVESSLSHQIPARNFENPAGPSLLDSRPPVMQSLPDVEQRTLEQLLGLPNTSNSQPNAYGGQNFATASGNVLNRSNSSGTNTVPDFVFRPDRVSQIMFNWRLKFTGGSNCLPVDSFIYRVNALTNQTLNGNFEILCRNASTLFEDKAGKWFWRFHKNFPNFQWVELCRELRRQYGDSRTDVDFREMIRDRKQKPNELFDDFYESVIDLVDRLDQPLPDRTLVEILRRNLQPEIQHEILNLTIASVSQLREICRRREFFMHDVRRKHGFSAMKQNTFTKRVSEVNVEEEETLELLECEDEEVLEVTLICWNCRQPGHRHDDCLADRTIFCYGCGKPQTYKPHCPKCSLQSKNFQKSAPKCAHKSHNVQ